MNGGRVNDSGREANSAQPAGSMEAEQQRRQPFSSFICNLNLASVLANHLSTFFFVNLD